MQNMNDPMRGFLEQLLSSWDGEPVKAPAAPPAAAPATPTVRASSVIRTLPETNAEEADLLMETAVPALSALAEATGHAVPAETPAAVTAEAAASEVNELAYVGERYLNEAVAASMTPATPAPPPAQVAGNEPLWRFNASASAAAPAQTAPASFGHRPPSNFEVGSAESASPTSSPWRLASPATPAPAAPVSSGSAWLEARAWESQPLHTEPAQTDEEDQQTLPSTWRVATPPPVEKVAADSPWMSTPPAPVTEASAVASIWRIAPANPDRTQTPAASTASIWRLASETAAPPASPPQPSAPAPEAPTASIWRLATPPTPAALPEAAVPQPEPPPVPEEDELATVSIWQLAPAVEEPQATLPDESAEWVEEASALPEAQPLGQPPAGSYESAPVPTPVWKLSAQPTPSSMRLDRSEPPPAQFEPAIQVPEPPAAIDAPGEDLPTPDWIQSPGSGLPNLDELWPDEELDTPASPVDTVAEPDPAPLVVEVAAPPASPAPAAASASRSLVDFTSALAMLAAARRAAAGLPVEPAPVTPPPAPPAPEEPAPAPVELVAAVETPHEAPETPVSTAYEWVEDQAIPAALEDEQAALLAALLDAQVADFDLDVPAATAFEWTAEPEPVFAAPLTPEVEEEPVATEVREPIAVIEPIEALVAEPAHEAEDAFVADAAIEPVAVIEPIATLVTEPAHEAEDTFAADAAIEPVAVIEPIEVLAVEATLEVEEDVFVAAEAAIEPVAPLVEEPAHEAEPIAALIPAPVETLELGVELEWEEMAEPAAQPAPTSTTNSEEDLATVVARLEASLPVAAPWDAGAEDQARAEQLRHLVFAINDERFGVRLENLLEVDNMPMWTGIPGMPHTVRGLINLRGEIVSLLDLRAILGLPHPETPKRGKIFVAATADRQFTSAFAVDEVDGISAFQAKQLKPVPALTQNETSRHITATVEDGERLVRILDVAAILAELEQTFSLDMLRM